MNLPCKLSVPDHVFPARQEFTGGTARTRNMGCYQKLLCGLLAMTWPFAAAFAQASSSPQQSSSSSQQSSSPQSSTQPQTQSKAQPATPDPPPQKEDSLAEAARKAKAKKPAPAKGKVYTEADLAGMPGNGVSVVGEDKPAGAGGTGTKKTDGKTKTAVVPMSGEDEEYWRGKSRALLDEIAATDQEIAKTKEEIKKFGSGGFDITTGLKNNIAYINDRNAQLKALEKHKTDLEKQLDELQDEGRKAGASPAWFR